MHELVVKTRFGALFLLWGLTLVVLWQVLTGKIATRGLLRSRTDPGRIDISKCQLLSFTFAAAFLYIIEASKHPAVLPTLPDPLLYLTGGSNIFFLASKFIQYRSNKS